MSVRRILALLGSDHDVDVAPLLARLDTLGSERATLTISHGFDRLGVIVSVATSRLAEVVGADQAARLVALAGERAHEVDLELEASRATGKRLAIAGRVGGSRSLDADLAQLAAAGVEPAVLEGARAAVTELGVDQLVGVADTVGADGARGWMLWVAQLNHDDALRARTKERIDRVATACKVTPAQRRVAGGLHESLARGQVSHVWLRGTRRALAPALGLVWDRVEWQPIQRMLAGFHPAGDPVARIASLARATEVELARVELVLGPTDPPALRIQIELEGA